MNTTQRVILAAGLLAFAAELLYCPILAPSPEFGTGYWPLWRVWDAAAWIDWPRLLVEVLVTAAAAAALALLAGSPPRPGVERLQ